MGWVNYPQEHQTYLDACFEASLRRGLPGAIIFSDSVINHRHYFNLQCTYYSCHCVIAMAIKLWANLKPEEETIISFFCEWENFALIEEQLWINNIFSKIFDWIVWHLLWAAIKAYKLLPSPKSDGFQCHNHNQCDYFCSTIEIDYFPLFFRWKIIANDVSQWLSLIGPTMRWYWCIGQV